MCLWNLKRSVWLTSCSFSFYVCFLVHHQFFTSFSDCSRLMNWFCSAASSLANRCGSVVLPWIINPIWVPEPCPSYMLGQEVAGQHSPHTGLKEGAGGQAEMQRATLVFPSWAVWGPSTVGPLAGHSKTQRTWNCPTHRAERPSTRRQAPDSHLNHPKCPWSSEPGFFSVWQHFSQREKADVCLLNMSSTTIGV